MYSDPSLLELALIATIILAATARNHLQSDETATEEARHLYSEGKIDEPELERRLGEAVDDRHEQIRLVVEDINGVGPKTSTAIAREYEGLDDLRASDRERLKDVYGVGEETAEAVLGRIR